MEYQLFLVVQGLPIFSFLFKIIFQILTIFFCYVFFFKSALKGYFEITIKEKETKIEKREKEDKQKEHIKLYYNSIKRYYIISKKARVDIN